MEYNFWSCCMKFWNIRAIEFLSRFTALKFDEFKNFWHSNSVMQKTPENKFKKYI